MLQASLGNDRVDQKVRNHVARLGGVGQEDGGPRLSTTFGPKGIRREIDGVADLPWCPVFLQ
jgi:hypothetical protein